MRRQREIRRNLGMFAVALGRLGLGRVRDPRRRKGSRPLWQMLTALLAGLTAGCNSVADVEKLTERMSPTLRPKLKIWGRIPDTTLRDLVILFLPLLGTLREILFRQNRTAHRNKQLEPVDLPCGIVAIDGKHVTTKKPDNIYAQHLRDDVYVVRTLTASLVSAPAATCLDALPIPKEKSESSAFPESIAALEKAYGRTNMFEIVSCDAGIGDKPNADLLHYDFGYDYIFAIKEDQPTLHAEVQRLLAGKPKEVAEAVTVDRLDNQTVVVRRLWRTSEMAGYHQWEHLQMGLRVQAVKIRDDGTVLSDESRFFVTSVKPDRLSSDEWLRVIRWHWRVENDCHKVWDVSFKEDDHPWFRDAGGMLVIQILRRVAYNILVLYRNVSRRGEHKACIPWRDLFEWMRLALTAATNVDVEGLRWPEPPRARSSPPPTDAVNVAA